MKELPGQLVLTTQAGQEAPELNQLWMPFILKLLFHYYYVIMIHRRGEPESRFRFFTAGLFCPSPLQKITEAEAVDRKTAAVSMKALCQLISHDNEA